MAKFEMEIPKEVMDDFEKIYGDWEEIFGGMTKAGADVVYSNMMANLPASLKASNFATCIKETVTYKTPSNDGVSTKVGIYGYFTNKNGEKVPAPLVANVFEFGRSNAPFPKQPFFRKSFKKGQIEKAMLDAQKRLSGGLLE